MVKRYLLFLLLLPGLLRAQSETPAQANKRLFDRTVDELNFQTMETVYDKSFTRSKFPDNLRTAAARRQFDGFGTNQGLKQLFLNYNGVAERFKNRFGNGPLTLAEFEKQLNSILLDRNFEFFIHNLPRDERVALIRAEQRLIKKATASFNAAGEPADLANVPPADVDAEAPVSSAPLTTNDDPTLAPAPGEPAAATAPAGPTLPATPSHHDWLDYFTLLLSLGSLLLLLHLILNVLPRLQRRVNSIAFGQPEEEPAPQPSFRERYRREASSELRQDSYEEEEEAEEDYETKA